MKTRRVLFIFVSISILLSMVCGVPLTVNAAEPVKLADLADMAYVEVIGSAYTLGYTDAPAANQYWYQPSYTTTNKLFSMSTSTSNTAGDGYSVKIQKDGNLAELSLDTTGTTNVVARYWLKGTTIANTIEYSVNGGLSYVTLTDQDYSNGYRVHKLEGADNNSCVIFRINGALRNSQTMYLDDIAVFSDTTTPTWDAIVLDASNITDKSMKLSWSAAKDSTNTLESGVRYYRIYKDAALFDTVTNTTSYEVTGLSANQSYVFSITAGDVAGNWSADGPTETFTTSAYTDTDPPIWPSPTDIAATHLGQRSVTVSWPDATDATGLQEYRIYKDSALVATVPSSVKSYTLNHLSPSTEYAIKVEASDILGNGSADGPGVHVTTLDAGTPFMEENFDSGSFPIGWTISSSGGTVKAADDPLGLYGKSLELLDTDAAKSVSARYKFGHKAGVLTWEYRFMHKDFIKTMYLPVYGSILDGADRELFRLSTASNDMLVYGNETSAYVNIGKINTDQWYRVRVVVDIDDKVSYFGIISEEDNTRFVSEANPLYGISSATYTPISLNEIGFYTKSTDLVNLYIDDIKVYDTDLSADVPAWPSGKSLTAFGISKKEITLNWSEATDYLGIKNYVIYKDGTQIAIVSGNTKTYTIGELYPGTAYDFRIEAEDAAGNRSVDGPSLNVSTSPKDETVPPVWTEAKLEAPLEDIGANTLKLVWTAATDNTGVTAYRIYQDGNLIVTVPGDVLSYTVTGLTEKTKYLFRVWAGDESDNWSEGPELEVSTIGDIRPPVWDSPYFGMELDSSTTGRLSISWRGASDNVAVTQYRVYEGSTLIATVTQAAITIDGLIPGQKHTYTVAAGDEAGNWSMDNPKATFQAHDPLLPVWQSGSLTAENVGASSLTLKWRGATDNGVVAKYCIYRDGLLVGIAEGTEYTVKDLLHDTSYQFKVQAVDAMNNESTDGPAINVTTAHSDDTTVPVWSEGKINVSDITTHSLSLSWSGAEDGVGVTGYRIYVGDSLIKTVYSETNSCTLYDLAPGMPYTFTVQACDAAGNWSVDGPFAEAATTPVFGTTLYVSSLDELNAAIALANPGDMIILRDGIYETGAIAPVADKHGLPNARIIIRAETAGMAEIKAVTGFNFTNCSYMTLEGIKFTGKQTLSSNSQAIDMLGCNNMRITRCHFILDETEVQNADSFSMAWVTIKSHNNVVSHHNKVDRNLFEKKLAPGVVLSIDGDWEAKQISQYDIIEYNHFKDIKPRIANGKETIRYGTSYNSQSSAHGIVQYNLFEECDGDPEILSVKTSDLTVRYNTFLNSEGQLTLRHGDRTTIYGNYFIGDGKKTGVGGIRIYGTDHKIFSNYFQGLTTHTLQIDGGDSYTNGRLTDKWTIRRLHVSYNTIINCSNGILIWNGREYAPQEITIANNLVVNSGSSPLSYVTSKSAVPGIPTPRPFYEGNMVYPSMKAALEANDASATSEIVVADPLMELANGIYRPSATSPALGAATGTYPYVTIDIDGQTILNPCNVGADQTSDSPAKNDMLTAAHVGLNASSVGPVWQSTSLIASEITASSLKLTWEGATDNKVVTQYRIYIGDQQKSSVIGNTNSVIISGLQADTAYTFKVQALDEDGNMNWVGPEVTTRTLLSGSSGNGSGSGSPLGGSNSDSDAASSTIKAEVKRNGTQASGTIEKGTLLKAFENAQTDSKGNRTVTAEVSEISGVNSYSLGIPAELLVSDNSTRNLVIRTAVAAVTLPENMLNNSKANISSSSIADLSISLSEKSNLSDDLKEAIGDRPLVQLTLKLDGKQTKWSNPNAPVNVSMPYKPTTEELKDPEHIVVWYIDGNGNVISVPSGRYDPVTGTVNFSITHFSYYAVAYMQKTFSDLGGVEWARNAIEVLASKGIINGTSKTHYSPSDNITRADYLVLLIKTLGLTADFTDNFDDVKPGASYCEAIGIAKKLGITAGSGNNLFNPGDAISRQDMMTMTARALEKFKGLKKSGDLSVLHSFSDKAEVAGYATESLATLIREGLISGDGSKLNPGGKTTRAAAAALLYRIYNKY